MQLPITQEGRRATRGVGADSGRDPGPRRAHRAPPARPPSGSGPSREINQQPTQSDPGGLASISVMSSDPTHHIPTDRLCLTCRTAARRPGAHKTCSPKCAEAWPILRTVDNYDRHRRHQARSILANPEGQKPSKITWARRMLSDDPPPPNRRYLTSGSKRADLIRKYRPEIYEELTADPLPPVMEDVPRFVYVIEAVGSDRFKVGVAIDPGHRLKRLVLGSPFPLELRFKRWTSVPFWVETATHRSLTDHRIHSEWFAVELPVIVDVIDGIIDTAEASIRSATP